jgi:hypothetical protein
VTAEPYTVYACHCHDCQRRTGSAFALSMIVKREAVELLHGEPAVYAAALPDGRMKRGRLCAACGTRLWGEPARAPVAVVQSGVLDPGHGITPVAHQWMSEAQPWVVLPPGVPRFERNTPDPLDMARLYRAAHPPS